MCATKDKNAQLVFQPTLSNPMKTLIYGTTINYNKL